MTGVRLDSGDLVTLSQKVRSLLPDAKIFASGDLDEYEIAKLTSKKACIDGYGLGTKLVSGMPVNGVYKIVEIDGIPTMKQSSNKVTYPGRKQIYRQVSEDGFIKDRLGLAFELPLENEQPLLELVMEHGQRASLPETLQEIQKRTAENVKMLSPSIRQLTTPTHLPVEISDSLQQLTEKTQRH